METKTAKNQAMMNEWWREIGVCVVCVDVLWKSEKSTTLFVNIENKHNPAQNQIEE